MLKKILSVAVVLTATMYAETSVFDAGDLNSNEPYGLSENEKILYQSKKKVENLSKDYTGANSRINNLSDKVEGMQSLIESLNKSTYDNANQLKQITKEFEEYKAKKIEDDSELDKKINAILYSTKVNAANIKKLQESIQELSKGVKQIATISSSEVSLDTSTSVGYDGQSKADVLKSAISDYNAKRYQEAQEKFSYLVDKKHKPAQCNYYLGQIAFENKDYDNALYYYKQSNELYKKANVKSPYMATILLNSGLSLKNQGKNEEAQVFFKALKDSYPDSAEAKKI